MAALSAIGLSVSGSVFFQELVKERESWKQSQKTTEYQSLLSENNTLQKQQQQTTVLYNQLKESVSSFVVNSLTSWKTFKMNGLHSLGRQLCHFHILPFIFNGCQSLGKEFSPLGEDSVT